MEYIIQHGNTTIGKIKKIYIDQNSGKVFALESNGIERQTCRTDLNTEGNGPAGPCMAT